MHTKAQATVPFGSLKTFKYGSILLVDLATLARTKKDKVIPVPGYRAIKTYGRVEVQLHAFLTSALDGGDIQAVGIHTTVMWVIWMW
jgi:hypothetical protein